MSAPELTLTECPAGYSAEEWNAVKDFRPDSYWEYSDPLQAILSRISGRARREMITDFWNAGIAEDLEQDLLEDELTEKLRKDLGRFHPFFMGGEYLPERLLDEVPIVRIELESATFDVIELRARRVSDRLIALRWVDEYESDFTQPVETVERPFSLEELIAFMGLSYPGDDESPPLPMAYTVSHVDFVDDPTELQYFTGVRSDFYPELHTWFNHLNSAWLASVTQEEEKEEAQ